MAFLYRQLDRRAHGYATQPEWDTRPSDSLLSGIGTRPMTVRYSTPSRDALKGKLRVTRASELGTASGTAFQPDYERMAELERTRMNFQIIAKATRTGTVGPVDEVVINAEPQQLAQKVKIGGVAAVATSVMHAVGLL